MIVIGVVVLVFVGPDRIPELMSTAGKYYGRFRRMSDDLRRAFNAEVARHEADRRRQELEARRLAAEAERQAQRQEAQAAEQAGGAPAEVPSGEKPADLADAPVVRPLPGGVARRPTRAPPPPPGEADPPADEPAPDQGEAS